MNKLALIVALSALVTGAALAQKPKPAPKTIKCAVMTSDNVDIAKATKEKMFADYKGRRYFFCCGGCPDAFKKAPTKYAKNASIPTPKSKKA
jgi:YHS domain-containing protein